MDLSGNIIPSGSWYVTNSDLNSYGFKLTESITNTANLMISGYDRDENWQDTNGNPVTGQSNIFVYEFNKATGAQTSPYTQYLVSHIEHSPEEFNFWSLQMPLIYYPDMSYQYMNNDGTGTHYYHVATEPFLPTRLGQNTLPPMPPLANNCIHLNKATYLKPLAVHSHFCHFWFRSLQFWAYHHNGKS